MPQTVQQLVGYRKRVWANFAVALSTVLTTGLVWVAAYLFPSIRLLPLQNCAFHEAHFVLAKVFLQVLQVLCLAVHAEF